MTDVRRIMLSIVLAALCSGQPAYGREEADWDPVPEIPVPGEKLARYKADLELRHQRRIMLAMQRAALRRARVEARKQAVLEYQLSMIRPWVMYPTYTDVSRTPY